MSADPAREAIKQFRRKLRDVLEHEPRELQIAINGRMLGSQTVNADLNRQNFLLDASEKIDFVEVFSEQGIRLLSMSIEPPPTGPFEHRVEARLSGDRSLQAILSFSGPSPSLEVVYRDPNFRTLTDTEPVLPLHSVPPAEVLPVTDETEIRRTSRRRLTQLVRQKWSWLPAYLLRPSVIAPASALILIAVVVLLRTPVISVSAAEILRQSVAAENADTPSAGVVLNRSLALSVYDRDGRLQLQRRVETWQSPTIKVRRLYDDKEQLVAGEWRKNDGSRTLYRSGEEPQQIELSRVEPTSPLTIDDAWMRETSAEEFSKLLAGGGALTIQEEGNIFRLTIVRPASAAISLNQIERATILLSRRDLRPIEQLFVVKVAEGTREFLFREAWFARRNSKEVEATVFEPDAVLLPGKEPILVEETPEPPLPAPSVAPVPVVATAELEIEVLSLLSQVGATLGEEVSVARTLDGSLQVSGVVENPGRKSAILSALAPISGHPVIKLQIETPDEAVMRLEKSRAASDAAIVQIEETAPATGTIAVDGELRHYLLAKGTPTDKLDEEVNQFANRALRSSRQAVLFAWSLRRMVQRFSVSELQSLDREARIKWLTMIGEHTVGYEREIAGLRAHLSLAFAARAAVDETATEIVDEAGLARVILRMAELSTNTDETIRSAFTLSGGEASAISSSEFWRTMSNAESLARKIAQSAQQLKVSTSRIPR